MKHFGLYAARYDDVADKMKDAAFIILVNAESIDEAIRKCGTEAVDATDLSGRLHTPTARYFIRMNDTLVERVAQARNAHLDQSGSSEESFKMQWMHASTKRHIESYTDFFLIEMPCIS